jgi:hypothetical protein
MKGTGLPLWRLDNWTNCDGMFTLSCVEKPRSATLGAVIGALVIAVILVILLPVAFLISGGVGAAILGWLLKTNADMTHEGSELIDTNY